MDKILMVIGAGKYQLPAIIKAKEMGLKVIATDLNPEAPGFRYADFHRIIDVKNMENNLEVAREFAIDGVISIVSELGVRTTAYIAEQLALPGLKYEAAIAATDKAIMRKKFLQANLPSPKFFKINTKEEAFAAILKLGLPVIIKPTDNSGSRGVTKIEKLADLDFSFSWAKENSGRGDIIVEQFLPGTEMTIEALSYNGKHHILAMCSKKRMPFPHCVSIDLTYPPPFPAEVLAKVKKVVISALNALGINRGATHTEVMMTDRGPMLVEVAARGGGFGIFSDIVPFVSGVDIVKECIKIAMGYEVNISSKYSRAAVLRFFSFPQGKIKKITGLQEARKIKGIYLIELAARAGERVKPITSDGSRHGHIVAFAETREEAICRADLAEATIKFEIAEQA